MLKFHRNPQFDFPHSIRGSFQHKFAFAPVIDEQDELINGIKEASESTWDLSDQPEGALEAFWDNVVADVRKDPQWNDFANDD
jgi:hypothetical protein